MVLTRNRFSRTGAAPVILALMLSLIAGGCRHKKYENPISKDTQQPDKVLFDKAINDIERGRYEVARITLNTLINTYDTSEFLAKAKLAIADSWYREGGSHGLAQAEAEYKDFILFYPTMEEAAESQNRICDIHYKQMEKVDRDTSQGLRAEAECRQLLVSFPNSKFVPMAEQKLRNIQEALAGGEHKVGLFYHHKGSLPAAANRLTGLVAQYPLYSQADESLWLAADSYSKMGPRFRRETGDQLARIIRDYPLSSYADGAKKKLKEMEMPVPEADPAAVARMKYENENRTKAGLVNSSLGFVKRGPNVSSAAKSGAPTMTPARPQIPVSIPTPAAVGPGGSSDVAIQQIGDSTALKDNPDARQVQPNGATPNQDAAAQQPAPAVQNGKQKKQKKPKKQNNVAAPTQAPPTGQAGNPGSAATDANPKSGAAKP